VTACPGYASPSFLSAETLFMQPLFLAVSVLLASYLPVYHPFLYITLPSHFTCLLIGSSPRYVTSSDNGVLKGLLQVTQPSFVVLSVYLLLLEIQHTDDSIELLVIIICLRSPNLSYY